MLFIFVAVFTCLLIVITSLLEKISNCLAFSLSRKVCNVSRPVTKPIKWHVRPAKTQISLGIRPVWSESSLCAQWVAKDPSFLHADSEYSDQTWWMPRLIWVFAWRTGHFVGFLMRWLMYVVIYIHRNILLTNIKKKKKNSMAWWKWIFRACIWKVLLATAKLFRFRGFRFWATEDT